MSPKTKTYDLSITLSLHLTLDYLSDNAFGQIVQPAVDTKYYQRIHIYLQT